MTKDIKGKILLKNIKENDVFHATWKQKEWPTTGRSGSGGQDRRQNI